MSLAVERLVYLVAAVCFITGLQKLQSPATARQGNAISGIGMLIAIVATLLAAEILTPITILAGMVLGSGFGFLMARTVRMTSMPQMVALLNGFGGAGSLLVGGAEFLRSELRGEQIPLDTGITIQLSLLIGAVTFSGSLIAFAKLQEVMTGKPITYTGQKVVSALFLVAVVALSAFQLVTTESLLWPFYAVCVLGLVLGVMLVIPIGGADMPVVIALLNSYSGLAAAMTGFVIDNSVLIVSGALVGSSGLILTRIMCKAMNRSLANVLFSAFGSTTTAGTGKSAAGLSVRSVSPEDAAVQLAFAQSVVIIPGYGMAVAQAQHVVREMQELIEKHGGEVKYAIHPVAGRMPGHMNVLLAEANVPYDKLREMDDINTEMERCDVAVVIGANDVVNPGARSDQSSPIFGMPIINADYAKSIIVLKRSMAAGFAGIENELFYNPKTSMLFGDAKQSLSKVIGEIKQL
jgi:NAD(P) transhydrogenase subunit beta